MAISTAIGASTVSRVIGVKTSFTDTNIGGVIYLPQRIGVLGQGNTAAAYSLDKRTIASEFEAGDVYGFGSPIHLAVRQLLPSNGDGVGAIPVTIYPVRDDAAGVAATASITPSGTVSRNGAFNVRINGEVSADFTVLTTDVLAGIATKITNAINGALSMPMSAATSGGAVNLTSKWKGASANELKVIVEGPTDTGITFATVQPSGGLVNPDLEAPLQVMGDVWETMILNCLDASDTDTLETIQTVGEGRWGALRRRPFVCFTGHAFEDLGDIQAITDLRKTDRVNVLLSNPGSESLPFVTAAGLLARIASVANNNPARDYGRQVAPYILPGGDGTQWDFAQRDQAVKSGISTVEVRDSEVTVSDTVTMFRPDGDVNPAYRFVKDIVKLQNIIFNIDLIFNTAAWDGAPLIPDNQPTVNPDAKKPKNAVSALIALAENLAADAVISDIDYTKSGTSAQISSQNPNRLDVVFPVKISGNANIISLDLNFGFFFGTNQVIN